MEALFFGKLFPIYFVLLRFASLNTATRIHFNVRKSVMGEVDMIVFGKVVFIHIVASGKINGALVAIIQTR